LQLAVCNGSFTYDFLDLLWPVGMTFNS